MMSVQESHRNIVHRKSGFTNYKLGITNYELTLLSYPLLKSAGEEAGRKEIPHGSRSASVVRRLMSAGKREIENRPYTCYADYVG